MIEQKRQKGNLKKRIWTDIRKNYELYLFVLPALIVLIIFNYIPVYGLQIAFKDFVPSKGINGSEWVGIKHFLRFVSGYQFKNLMRNTFILALQVIFLPFLFR